MILVDTGPLVVAANRKDALHSASVAALAAARPPRLVPGLVIAEVSYLLARDATAAVIAGTSVWSGLATSPDLNSRRSPSSPPSIYDHRL